MKKYVFYILFVVPAIVYGQEERKYIREGYRAYMKEDYNEAEVGFRKAEDISHASYIARYNTSTALYQQQQLEESGKRFTELMEETTDPMEEAKLLHNLGNVMLGGKQYQQAVDAYKKSLRINPGDDDTRYNLAYALEKLRDLQEQEQNDQNQDQQNDQEQGQQEQQNDQQQQDQDEEQQQQESQQQQQENQQENEEEQQQPQKQELTKEESERLLDAILAKEKDVKEKVDKKRAAAAKIKTEKDW